MKTAAIQLNSQSDIDENLVRAEALVAEAAEAGARFVCLPEGFAYLGPERGRASLAERLDAPGPITSALARWAHQHQIWLLGGGMPEASDDERRPYNTSLLFRPTGELAARYRKIHLFDVDLDDGTSLHESRGSTAGDEVVVADVSTTKVGLAICYDLRFARLFEMQRDAGARVLTVPAAFTRPTGKAHWHVLLRARAIETQSWVVAPAQTGEHPKGRTTYGHSVIVSPWGEVVAERVEGEGIVLADVDDAAVEKARRQIPVATHRRL